jgi:transposase-like protein
MPKAFPEEFRRDVVADARRREASMRQVAKDFGISETCFAPLDQARRDRRRLP